LQCDLQIWYISGCSYTGDLGLLSQHPETKRAGGRMVLLVGLVHRFRGDVEFLLTRRKLYVTINLHNDALSVTALPSDNISI
jgi:hypothetical protein